MRARARAGAGTGVPRHVQDGSKDTRRARTDTAAAAKVARNARAEDVRLGRADAMKTTTRWGEAATTARVLRTEAVARA